MPKGVERKYIAKKLIRRLDMCLIPAFQNVTVEGRFRDDFFSIIIQLTMTFLNINTKNTQLIN